MLLDFLLQRKFDLHNRQPIRDDLLEISVSPKLTQQIKSTATKLCIVQLKHLWRASFSIILICNPINPQVVELQMKVSWEEDIQN